MERIEQGGKVGDFRKDFEKNVSHLVKYIKENPDGFTISLDGKVPSSGFVVLPYKDREKILYKVASESLRDYITQNYDMLVRDNHKLGG